MSSNKVFEDIQFLQIGFQKCGTTYFEKALYQANPEIMCIQAACVSELENLLLDKFILPDSLEYNRSEFEKVFYGLATKLFPKEQNHVNGIMFEPFTFLYQKRFDRINVLNRIYESFPKIKIIMQICNQESWVISHYSEYV